MDKYIRPASKDIIETILVLFLLIALMLALYDVLHVFFGVLTFALIFSVSFAKLYEKFVRLLKNRRKLAAILYAVILTAIIAIPLVFLFSALIRYVKYAIVFVGEVKEKGLPPLPLWVTRLPVMGDRVSSFWLQFQANPQETLILHEEQVRGFLQHIMTSGLGLLGVSFQLIIGIIISALFLVKGEKILHPIKSSLQHLLGKKSGLALLEATAMSIKGVSVGVMGTAFIAAIVSWIGLTIAGIQFALGLSAFIFFLVVIQIGPLLVWIPLIIWMAVKGHTGMMIFLIIYGILLVIIDSVIKPILIGKSGGKIPFLVLFLGVVGGITAWGFTGMFKGAIILAVFYTVFTSWLEKKNLDADSEFHKTIVT
ncbi:MAG: AI-2E family transporter [Ginsengibacter sp.]